MWRVHLLGPLILLPCSKTQSPHLFPHEYSKKISRREPPWIFLTVFNLVHFCLLRWKFDSIFFFLYQRTEQLFPSFYSSFFIFWRMARVPSVLLFKLNKVLMCSNFDQYFFFFFQILSHNSKEEQGLQQSPSFTPTLPVQEGSGEKRPK